MKYDKKTMELSKKLGALQFQKLVFLLERVKYYVVDKFFPNTVSDYSKRLDKRMSKELKKCNNDTERIEIVNKYRFAKLKYKKEINNKENRNYHVDMNNPLEFIKYLEKNKKIHVNGLKSNVIASYCSNLEEFYAQGSGITAVILPRSGFIKHLYLPDTVEQLVLTD